MNMRRTCAVCKKRRKVKAWLQTVGTSHKKPLCDECHEAIKTGLIRGD